MPFRPSCDGVTQGFGDNQGTTDPPPDRDSYRSVSVRRFDDAPDVPDFLDDLVSEFMPFPAGNRQRKPHVPVIFSDLWS